MGLAHKLNELTAVSEQRLSECTVGQLIESLSADDASALISALNSPASTRSIHEALKAESYKVDRSLLSLHRKGFCRCKERPNE